MDRVRAYYEQLSRRVAGLPGSQARKDEQGWHRRRWWEIPHPALIAAAVAVILLGSLATWYLGTLAASDRERMLICAAVGATALFSLAAEGLRTLAAWLFRRRRAALEAAARGVTHDVEAALSLVGVDPQVATFESMHRLGERIEELERAAQ